MICRISVVAILLASLCVATDAPLWEPGKVIAIEPVSTPAREADPSCRATPKGGTPPAECRPANLRAQKFWRVTIDAGNKRYVVRPYRQPGLLDSLNQAGTVYVDPNLTAGRSVELSVSSNKEVRIRTDQGQGIPALVDSQELISKADLPAPRQVAAAPVIAAAVPADSKVVLLQDGDFVDLEVQDLKAQDIGDGAVVYSFTGEASPVRISGGVPVFLVLGQSAGREILELARLQTGKESRQVVYSTAKKRSASSVLIGVTQVSDTVRKINVSSALPAGEYVFVLGGSGHAFLFAAR